MSEDLHRDDRTASATDEARRKSFSGDFGSILQDADKEPLPNGAYLRPGDTNLPPFHPGITERRADAEERLRHSIQSFFATAERVMPARKERDRRRAALAETESISLTPAEKAAITRRVTAEVAAAYGFPDKTLPRPVHQLETGSQGNGKTRPSLAGIAAIRADLTVRKYAPTLERAEEDLREYRKLTTEGSMPGMVVRGRNALDPLAAPGVTMCRRPAVTDRAAKLGISPKLTICKGCEFFGKCGTIRQENTIAALGTRAVFFVNREYAHLPCPAPDPDIVIGDEQMTLPAVSITSIEPAKLVGELVPYRRDDVGQIVAAARTTLERLRAPLMSAHPLDAIREEEGITKKQLQTLRNLLENEEEPFLHGSMADAKIDKELDKIDHPDRRHALAIVAAVLREIEAPRATLNAVRYSKRRDLILASTLRAFFDGIKDTAVLLLDGTGDLELNEKLTRTKLTHNVVRMERDAEVYGTIGKRYSRQSVIGKNIKGEPIRPEAAKKLRDEIGLIASHFDTSLLTATKQAEEALVEGGHLPADVVTSHGGMTRSINKWEKDRQTAIDVAPDAASIEDLELIAGAFYARDPEPIVSMAQIDDLPADWPYKPWPYRASRLRRFADGKLQVVHVDVHPDPRVDRIFQQITDANIIQNLDRVRPIYNHRTLVALNERVLDLTYTRVSRHRELVDGGTRIDRVLKKTDGILPLTPATLFALFPAEVGSVRTARRAVEAWRKWGHGSNGSPIWGVAPLSPYLYRRPGQPGSASVVMVADSHPDPKAAAEAVLGPLAAFWAAPMQEPQHPTEPPPAGPPGELEEARQGDLHPGGWQHGPPPGRFPPWMSVEVPDWQARAPPDG